MFRRGCWRYKEIKGAAKENKQKQQSDINVTNGDRWQRGNIKGVRQQTSLLSAANSSITSQSVARSLSAVCSHSENEVWAAYYGDSHPLTRDITAVHLFTRMNFSFPASDLFIFQSEKLLCKSGWQNITKSQSTNILRNTGVMCFLSASSVFHMYVTGTALPQPDPFGPDY